MRHLYKFILNLKLFISSLFGRSNDFRDDAYGHLTNQISHMAGSVMFVIILAAFWYDFTNELPSKINVSLITVGSYALFHEVRQYIRNGIYTKRMLWDGIIDTLYVSAPVYYSLFAMENGISSIMRVDVTKARWVILVTLLCVFVGAYNRWKRSLNNEQS